MDKIHLKVVSPIKLVFDGKVDSIIARTTEGDVGIMTNHINYFASLSTGLLRIFIDDEEKRAICSNGFIQVSKDYINIISDYCDFISDISVNDIEANINKYEDKLQSIDLTDEDKQVFLSNIKMNKKILNIIKYKKL